MEKKIVHLSDTSHPFTTYVDESDETDGYRTLTDQEFAAIRAFQSDWGYTSNTEFRDDLVDMLADTNTPTHTLIDLIMRKWDLDIEIRTDIQNLFIVRLEAMVPFFTPNEVKALESLPGEMPEWKTERQIADEADERGREFLKTIKSSRRQLFRQEADKQVYRYFIGQSGWAWFVHFIVDMPESYDTADNRIKALYQAKDGMTTLHMTSLYMSEEKAWDSINRDIQSVTSFDDTVLTHVVELDKM